MADAPFAADVLKLARWVLGHKLIQDNYALGGGSWLTLRHPQKARVSTDVDIFSGKESVSSYRAMMELVKTCDKKKIPYTITRRGEHFCQIFIGYPVKRKPVKVDIGKIWRPVRLLDDKKLGCRMISPRDIIIEKLHCIVDRIEPTDVYDLCVLQDEYPKEFRSGCADLARTAEQSELLAIIHRRLADVGGEGTKLKMHADQIRWMEQKIADVIREITESDR